MCRQGRRLCIGRGGVYVSAGEASSCRGLPQQARYDTEETLYFGSPAGDPYCHLFYPSDGYAASSPIGEPLIFFA